MRVEEIALRQEIRQMISEAGINKNTIQEMAEQIFKKEIREKFDKSFHEKADSMIERTLTSYKGKDLLKEALKGVVEDQITVIASATVNEGPLRRWHSVDKELPKDEKRYLVTLEKTYGTPDRFLSIANYLKFDGEAYWHDIQYGYLGWDKYTNGAGGTKVYKVIAWMPLPKPY